MMAPDDKRFFGAGIDLFRSGRRWYRRLPRRQGVTIRKTIELSFAASCIKRGDALQLQDRYLGLIAQP
ncbi:hypothetical protein [Bosea sp. (in: a-proteobacteria)]|uniref:hypothetical protein n=1 Tax=Bosea sp. (in: a-proteobacteria) TaxID=1871050 RepID=UPI0040333932